MTWKINSDLKNVKLGDNLDGVEVKGTVTFFSPAPQH